MTLSIEKAIKDGWAKTKAHLPLSAGVVLASFFVGLLLQVGESVGTKSPVAMLSLVSLGAIFAAVFVRMIVLKVFFTMYDGREVEWEKQIPSPMTMLHFFLATLIYSAGVFVGTLLLIIPGIILMIVFGFYSFLIIDKDLDTVAALKESMYITKGNRFTLFLLLLVLTVINIFGFLALIIGLLVTVPVTIFTLISAYRTLVSKEPSYEPLPKEA